ncbi:MAG: glutathione peroxidase [Alphaproteobacteria bacterium]|nr:glutathione peroxidase [Alphaproteobacteria bacterium]
MMIYADHTLAVEYNASKTAYQFSFNSLNTNKKLNLSDFEGKVILIVNTASKCGFTSQYADLEKLHQAYKHKGLVIIGVPSNDFGGQEPGSNEEITTFCQLNYGVTFPMTQKEKVSGDDAHPFYKWSKETLGFGTAPKWNFHKYLINRQGQLIDYFHSTTSPQSDRFKKAIETALDDIIFKAPE